MGATNFQSSSFGKTPVEAFNEARESAAWEHGHGGYTGTIAEKHDFVEFTLPPRLSVAKFIEWVEEYEYDVASVEWITEDVARAARDVREAKAGHVRAAKARLRERQRDLAKAERTAAAFKRKVGAHHDLVVRASRVYEDKWGPAVAVKVSAPSEIKRLAPWNQEKRRGQSLYVFFGMASC